MGNRLDASGAALKRRKDGFFRAFPAGRNLERALRTTDNPTPLFFFYPSQLPDLKDCWVVVGRVGRQIEHAYSITSEVVFLFTPYGDLQRRTFNALTENVRGELHSIQQSAFDTVRFTPDKRLAFLFAPDHQAGTRIAAWNAEGSRSLVVPVPELTGEPNDISALRAAIATVAVQRDVYRGRNPVWGSEFFGRNELIGRIESSLRVGRSVGLFGLRRSGKTSVLRQLQEKFETAGTVVVLLDLESIDSTSELPAQISTTLVDSLRRSRVAHPDVWIGPETEHVSTTFSELSNRLKRVAEKNRELTLVLAIDEIENLRRLANVDGYDKIRSFLGALRRSSQAVGNTVLLLTGITSEFFDSSTLGPQIDNPLFGFVEPTYLGPFTPEETAVLLTTLGRLMLLGWDDDALKQVHCLAGGFPFFVRELASAVSAKGRLRQAGEEPGTPLKLGIQDVANAEADWRAEATLLWTEIVRSLEKYHGVMAEMCRADSDDRLREWLTIGDEGERAQTALVQLGLVERDLDGQLRRSEVLKSYQSLGRPATSTPEALRLLGDVRDRVNALRAQQESLRLEFKSTARVNLRTGQPDTKIAREVIKTVGAFMNSEGGDLLLGVADDGSIVGVERDVEASQRSWDAYVLWLMHSTLAEAFGAGAVSTLVSMTSCDIDGARVVCLTVKSSPDSIWATIETKEHLFVRMEAFTKELSGRTLGDYLKNRSHKTRDGVEG